jgi:hypothetical protein
MTESNRFAKYASPRWKPESVGNKIAGTLVSTREQTGQSGDEFPVLTLATDEGEREVFASQFHLKELLNEHNPADGDWLEIKLVDFKGTAMGKMKIFTLEVIRDGEAF